MNGNRDERRPRPVGDPRARPSGGASTTGSACGFTLVELVIVVAIVGILAAAVLPLAHWSVKRQQEYELQRNLRIIRNALDRYHDLAAAGAIEVPPGDTGYPPDLDVLVEGVELIGEIPSPVPGVSDEYTASGFGLTGGYAGAAQDQGAAGAVGIEADAGARGGARGGAAAGRDAALQGAMRSTMREMQDLLMESRAGGRGGLGLSGQGGLGQAGRGGGRSGLGLSSGGARGGAFDRRRGAAPRGGAADVRKIVFLRRLPVDPMTGEADWGLRCYGDSIDDRSWCGRNVFDVYSSARGRGMDGRPYREW